MGMKGLRSPWPVSLPTWMCARGLHVLFIRWTKLALPYSLCIPVGEASGGHGDEVGDEMRERETQWQWAGGALGMQGK